MTRQKNISILGATGSIGDSTLSIIRQHPDRFRIVSLTCHRSVEKLCELIHEFRPEKVSVHSTSEARHVREAFPELEVFSGKEDFSVNYSILQENFKIEATELLTLENYLTEYFDQILTKLKDLNYNQSQTVKRRDLTF